MWNKTLKLFQNNLVSHVTTVLCNAEWLAWTLGWSHRSAFISDFNLWILDEIRNNIRQLDSWRWFSQRCSPTPQYYRVRAQRAMTPNFELGWDFCTMHLPPEVSLFYVYSFGSYRVDKQTNRCRWKHPTLFATLRLLGNNYFSDLEKEEKGWKRCAWCWKICFVWRDNQLILSNLTDVTATGSEDSVEYC